MIFFLIVLITDRKDCACAMGSDQFLGLFSSAAADTTVCIRKATSPGQDLYLRGGDRGSPETLSDGRVLQWTPPNNGLPMAWSGKLDGIDNWCISFSLTSIPGPTEIEVKGFFVDNNNGQTFWEPNVNQVAKCSTGDDIVSNDLVGSDNHVIRIGNVNQLDWGSGSCKRGRNTRICIKKNTQFGQNLYLRGGPNENDALDLVYGPRLAWTDQPDGIDNWCLDSVVPCELIPERDVYYSKGTYVPLHFLMFKGYLVDTNTGEEQWEPDCGIWHACSPYRRPDHYFPDSFINNKNHAILCGYDAQFSWGNGACSYN